MKVIDTPITGAKLVERRAIGDERGRLTRLFCEESLRAAGWDAGVAQINHTITRRRGAVRGMHFQHSPYAELKLVSCLHGEVWDVVVDLRRGSPTFLQWHAQALSPDNGLAMLIPHGCAHGFQALTDGVELVYCHSAPYRAEAEGGVSPRDPRLAIDWPLAITELSERDNGHPLLDDRFVGLGL